MQLTTKLNSINRLALLLINGYQLFISHFNHGNCRFYPSCSQYAKVHMSYNDHFFKALYCIVKRLVKCHQYHPGGFDYPKIPIGNNALCLQPYNPIQIMTNDIKIWLIVINKDDKEAYYIDNFTQNTK